MPDPTFAAGPDGFPRSGWTPPDTGLQFAPGGYAPAAPAPDPVVPQPAAPRRAPVVRDLSGRPLTQLYDLLWPKEVDGVEIRQVVLRRMSTGEVAAFVDRVRAAGEGASDRFPLFYRVDGALLSDDEWNALDTDDTDALGERAERFLPGRFRAARAGAASSPPALATTGSSSAA